MTAMVKPCCRYDHSKGKIFEPIGSQYIEESWSCLITDRENEQGETHCLRTGGHAEIKMAEEKPCEQNPGHRSE